MYECSQKVMEYHSTGAQSGVGSAGGRGTHLAVSVINGIYCIFNVRGHRIKNLLFISTRSIGYFPLQHVHGCDRSFV